MELPLKSHNSGSGPTFLPELRIQLLVIFNLISGSKQHAQLCPLTQ